MEKNKLNCGEEATISLLLLWKPLTLDVILYIYCEDPCHDPRYQNLPISALPNTESLKESVARVVPYWEDTICPAVLDNKSVIVVAHGNSLRSIVKHLDNVSNEGIVISFKFRNHWT